MPVSRTVMRKAAELLDAGTPFALCTVVKAKGSAPAKTGSKMIVLGDGSAIGTVGGAGLEEKVKAMGRECLASRASAIRSFDLAYYKEGGLDSLCGGTVEVLVEYMSAVPHILICGGGHVGLEVAKLCDQLDYRYSVLDARADYASKERFPRAIDVVAAAPEEFLPQSELSAYSHVVLLGHSHKIDTDILFECVRRFPGWIGVISSKMKRKEMFMRLKARGVAESELARVEAPVGVPIGSETPAECAVSILASIIRNHKLGSVDEEAHVKETEERK